MEPKINDFWYFFEKGENARNHCIYNLKNVSGHVKSHQKSMKIDAKTRLEKGMQIWSKSEPKGSQNGGQNASKMPKRSQRGAKGAPKLRKGCKKGMPKMMPNFDTENEREKCDFWGHFDSPGGRREVRRASLRRRRFAMLASFIWNAWHWPVSADFGTPVKSQIC